MQQLLAYNLLHMASQVQVFVSYSHQDEKYLAESSLLGYMKGLQQEGVEFWWDRRIGAGELWNTEIQARVANSHVALVLVSQWFLDSAYCRDKEIREFLDKRIPIVPVVLSACEWERHPWLAERQYVPRDGQNLESHFQQDGKRKELFLELRQNLRQQIDAVKQEKAGAQVAKVPQKFADLGAELQEALLLKEDLICAEESVEEVEEKILDLRRKIRQGNILRPGDFLCERFKLLAKLGKGGFADVWKAYDRKRTQLVAVKILHHQYVEDRSRRERFFRGARKMAELRDQGIVDVLDVEMEDDGRYFFVMEFVEGGDLRQAILRRNMTVPEKLQIIRQTGKALAVAHARGWVHRDVKPENILLGTDGLHKLTDFDLVRAADTTGGTRTGAMGTFVYAAPEMLENAQEAGTAADIFGLGMTAIFALYGKKLPTSILRDPAKTIAKLPVDDSIRQALLCAVDWEPEARFQTVEEFYRLLECQPLPPPALALSSEQEHPATKKPQPKTSPPQRQDLAKPQQPQAGTEWIHPVSGVVLVYVPGGEYTIGSNDHYDDEKPEHRVLLSPFWIGKYPVTNAEYATFMHATDRRRLEWWTNQAFNQKLQPVVNVSWHDANVYCNWAGLTLPTEIQWEAAARGLDGRPYPWGEASPTGQYAHYDQGDAGCTAAVDAYPLGTGPFGTLGQAGNVLEWCADPWESTAYRWRDTGYVEAPPAKRRATPDRVVRGGAWVGRARDLRAAYRGNRGVAERRYRHVGFRVLVPGSGSEH